MKKKTGFWSKIARFFRRKKRKNERAESAKIRSNNRKAELLKPNITHKTILDPLMPLTSKKREYIAETQNINTLVVWFDGENYVAQFDADDGRHTFPLVKSEYNINKTYIMRFDNENNIVTIVTQKGRVMVEKALKKGTTLIVSSLIG